MDEPSGSGRGAVLALVVVVALVLGGLWLNQHLRATARVQDCVMAGRTNCAPASTAN